MKYDIIIAIDPDVDKSGVAYLEVETRKLECSGLTFPQLLDYLLSIKGKEKERELLQGFAYKKTNTLVLVEAGYLNRSNWHVNGSNSRASTKIGNNTGRNHETARKIIEMTKHYGFEVREVKPLKKFWKGLNGKITHEELNSILKLRRIPPLIKSNQDVRDSCLILLSYL